jgi:hypothetical protein
MSEYSLEDLRELFTFSTSTFAYFDDSIRGNAVISFLKMNPKTTSANGLY